MCWSAHGATGLVGHADGLITACIQRHQLLMHAWSHAAYLLWDAAEGWTCVACIQPVQTCNGSWPHGRATMPMLHGIVAEPKCEQHEQSVVPWLLGRRKLALAWHRAMWRRPGLRFVYACQEAAGWRGRGLW